MLKKILFTLLIIVAVYFFVRWRQRKVHQVTQQKAAQQSEVPQRGTAIYYLAGSVITLMVVSVLAWIYYTLN